MIIGISGFEGSGKNTLADVLVKEFGFKQESFAGHLKDVLSSVFQWDREMLEGATLQSRESRTKTDVWWSEKLGYDVNPKDMMRTIGTDLFRNHFNEDVWVYSLERKLSNCKNIVLSDVRFANEAKMVKRLGGILIRVKRGDDPDWFDTAVRANTATSETEAVKNQRILDALRIHTSETKWIGLPFDYTVENDSTVYSLEETARLLFKSLGI